ncbi:MAG: hypothetical protein HYZ57_00800 [Acidobacteria bacterium]|nr:hypothetical protein [Acidobacteriota bacterium]MBI3278360.1 hypothetical protein [Acidobacteriota bacterium]
MRGEPAAGAVLDVWQASSEGQYDNTGYTLRGIIQADERGVYRLKTVVPRYYKAGSIIRPAHIHFKLRATGCKELTTQLYFKGDPYNSSDQWVRASLMIDPQGDAAAKRAKFDFVLHTA